jgi:hypothetical protein
MKTIKGEGRGNLVGDYNLVTESDVLLPPKDVAEQDSGQRSIPVILNSPPEVVPQSINPNPMLGIYQKMFGNTGINTTRMARAWSIQKTPIFAIVQNSPIVRHSQVGNRIQAVIRNNIPGVSGLRLF